MSSMDIPGMANQAADQGPMSAQTAREVSILLSANTGPFQQEMKKASSAADELANALHRAEKAYQGALKFIGRGAIGIGAAMQAQAAGSIWSAVQFEESFARVAKTTGLRNELQGSTGAAADFFATFGAGDNELQQFENDIRALSTQIPVSVTELSHLADVAGTLGVESDNLSLFAETAAQLGAGINELSSDVAIAGLSNLIGAFGMAETEVKNLGSSLADLANHTRGSATDMLEFSERLAGTAVQVGMTADEVLGLGAAVSAIGAQPRLGATAIMQTITQISKAVQEGTSDLGRFAQAMGMTSDELEAMWSDQGPTQVLMELLTALNSQGEQATVTLDRLGLSGSGATQVLGGLAAQLDVVADAMGMSVEAFDDGMAVTELAEVRFNTVIKALQRFRQSTTEVFRSMGQGFLVVMKQLIDAASGLVNIFNELPQPIKTTMGLIAGIGGVALVAAGAFTLFFAQFHVFFITLSTVNALLPVVIARLQALGASGSIAAEGFRVLQQKLAAVLGWFTTAEGTALSLSEIFRKTMTSAIGMLSKALNFLWKQLRLVAAWLVRVTVKEMVEAFALMQAGTVKLTKALGAMLIPLGKIALIAAAVGAAIYAVTGGKEAWAEATEKVTSRLDALAQSAGLATKGIEELQDVIDEFARAPDIAVEFADIIDHLKELENFEAERFLFRYGMQLLASGNPPDQVKRLIDELAELSRTPIVFEYTLQELRHGEGLQEVQDKLSTAVSDTGELLDSMPEESNLSRLWNWLRDRPTPRTEAQFSQTLAGVSFAAGGMDVPGRIALAESLQQDIQEALDEELINPATEKWLQDQIDEMNLIPESFAQDSRSAWERWGAGQRDMGFWDRIVSMTPFGTPGERDTFGNQEMFAQAIGDETLMDAAHMERVRELVEDVTGETENLSDAVRGLDDEGWKNLVDGMAELQREINDTIADAEGLISKGSRIQEAFFLAEGMDETEAQRMLDSFFETLPHEIGFARAIDEADEELQRLVDDGKEWGDEADRIRTTIKDWSEEFAKIQVNDIARDMNAMTAAEQVRHLNNELRNLESDSPYAAQVEVEIRERRQQALGEAEQEFRQGMERYDSLLEQREDTIEDHNRRLEQMEEDHQRRIGQMREDRDKSIRRANESYQKRLDEIKDEEKEALEERAENMAHSFDLMERIQARPSTEIGALRDNMRAQNRAMEEMTSNLDQLRSMGLDEDVMEQLGFDDPQNFAAVRRLLESALSDPSMISEVNALWRERLDLSEAFVDESETDAITERFDEMRQRAKEGLDEQLSDIQTNFDERLEDANESYARSVEDANESHQRQLESIAEALADLGQSSLETIDELIAKASESGLEKLQAWAKEIQSLQEDVDELDRSLAREGRGFDPMDPASIDREFGIRYDETGQSIVARFIDGFQRKTQEAWGAAKRFMEENAEEAMRSTGEEIDDGVEGWKRVLDRISDQDDLWSETQLAGERGAGDFTDGVISSLEDGTVQIHDIMREWNEGIETGLNPVLEAIGENPVGTTSPSRPGGNQAFAEGGMLPDQARIQGPGTLVQWAEPETGGEAFIPLSPSKRQRSVAIWEKTGQLLGMEFANGGFLDSLDFSDELGQLGRVGEATDQVLGSTNEKIERFLEDLGIVEYDPSSGDFTPRSGQYGGVLPWVAWSANVINSLFGPMPGGIGGVGQRANRSDHPRGLALDFMVGDNPRGHAMGDRIARFLLSNWTEHAMKYLIWKQRISYGGSWNEMAPRGSRTADHFDHPHASYKDIPGPGFAGPESDARARPAREASQSDPDLSKEGTPSGRGGMMFMANGGIDNIPAWVTQGEFVMNSDAVDKYGVDWMEAVNAQRFANGGLVGSMPRTRGREPIGGGQTDLVNALTKALENASLGSQETNNWDVKVEARDVNDMLRELESKRRLSRLTGAKAGGDPRSLN